MLTDSRDRKLDQFMSRYSVFAASQKKYLFEKTQNYYSELLLLGSLFPTILHNEIYKHLTCKRQHGAGEEANKKNAWI